MGRADYVPVFLSDIPRLFESRAHPARRGVGERHAARRPRLLLAEHERRGDARRDPRRQDRRRPAQPRRCRGRSATASSTSTTSTWRSRSTSRRTSTPSPTIGDVERRIGGHVAELVSDGATLQLGIGAIPSATAQALTDKKDLGIHTEMFTDAVVDLVEAGVVTGAAQGAQPRQDRDDVPDGLAAAVRVRPRQPDGRDAAGRLHQRHPRHPLVQQDGLDQLGHRDRPDGPGRGGLDRPHDVLGRRRPDGLHARRGAGARGARDHRAPVDRGAGDAPRGSSRTCARAPASSPRGRTSGRS